MVTERSAPAPDAHRGTRIAALRGGGVNGVDAVTTGNWFRNQFVVDRHTRV
jgi:hypothetical protein